MNYVCKWKLCKKAKDECAMVPRIEALADKLLELLDTEVRESSVEVAEGEAPTFNSLTALLIQVSVMAMAKISGTAVVANDHDMEVGKEMWQHFVVGMMRSMPPPTMLFGEEVDAVRELVDRVVKSTKEDELPMFMKPSKA